MYKLTTYSTLSLLLIKQLTGEQSQIGMSNLLGKKYNIYHRWETGEQRIKLLDFLKIIDVLEIDFKKYVYSSFSFRFLSNDLFFFIS